MKTILRILNVIVFLPVIILVTLYAFWYRIDEAIINKYKVKK